MSEEAPVDASASAGVAFAKGTILEKEEISTAADVRMESFFDDADVVIEAMASTTVATTKEIPVEALVPPSGLVSTEESTPVVSDVELSPNEGPEEILEDSNDEPIMKTRVPDSDDASDNELDTKAIVIETPEEPKVATISVESTAPIPIGLEAYVIFILGSIAY
nr:hypothetical protein CFP56_38091 [Quercus suber]